MKTELDELKSIHNHLTTIGFLIFIVIINTFPVPSLYSPNNIPEQTQPIEQTQFSPQKEYYRTIGEDKVYHKKTFNHITPKQAAEIPDFWNNVEVLTISQSPFYERNRIYYKYLPLETALKKIAAKKYITYKHDCRHFSLELKAELEKQNISSIMISGFNETQYGHRWLAVEFEPISGRFIKTNELNNRFPEQSLTKNYLNE